MDEGFFKMVRQMQEMKEMANSAKPPHAATAVRQLFESQDKFGGVARLAVEMAEYKNFAGIVSLHEQFAEKLQLRELRQQYDEKLARFDLFKGATLSSFQNRTPHILKLLFENQSTFIASQREWSKYESLYGNLIKTSRIISDLANRQEPLYQVNYDFSEIVEPDNEKESGIITGKELISEAYTIKKTIEDIYRNNAKLFTIRWEEFEDLIAELLRNQGYTVEQTGRTRDGGKDIIALASNSLLPAKYLVECKHNRKDRKIGVGVVRSFFDVITQERATGGIICASSYFTRDARIRQKASPYQLELKDHDAIINWVNEYMLSF